MSADLSFSLLAEEDFLSAMEGACADWRAQAVSEGVVHSSDNTPLHYYIAVPNHPRAGIILVHGLCEFFGKYHEYAWYLYRAGYAVFFCEQRGHGHSGGKLIEPDSDVVWIDDYATYVEDLHAFVTQVVQPRAGALPLILLGHSMGGAVAARYAETHPGVVQAMLLSSPMFRLRAVSFPYPLVMLLRGVTRLTGKDQHLAPGERHFDHVNVFATSSARSRARYDYVLSMREADRDCQTYGSSWGWVTAGIKAIRQIMRDGTKIRIPVTLFSAGEDRLVAPEGYDAFCQVVPQTARFHYEDSAHELFNADTDTRQRYFADVLHTLELYTEIPHR